MSTDRLDEIKERWNPLGDGQWIPRLDQDRREDMAWLLDEVDSLRSWKVQALDVMTGLQDLGKALGLPLGTSITGAVALNAVERLKAEVDLVTELVEQAAYQGRRTTLDPGAFVTRARDADGDYERMDQWRERALRHGLAKIWEAAAERRAGQ